MVLKVSKDLETGFFTFELNKFINIYAYNTNLSKLISLLYILQSSSL